MFSVLRCIVLRFSTRSIHAGDRLEELYASVPKKESERIGVTDSLIRLSVGLEDVEDLITDLSEGLAHV
jgi:cystathionine beta-lyase